MAARGKIFGPAELKQLCYSFLEISQDPCVGSRQRKENLWERVRENYKKRKSKGLKSRTAKSLESKWGDVRKTTTRFIACVKTVEDFDISGTNNEDTLIKVKELYKTKHSKGKEFSYIECYKILKDYPRWMLMAMLSLPTDHLDHEALACFKLWRAKEMATFMDSLSTGSHPTPPTGTNSIQDIVAHYSSK